MAQKIVSEQELATLVAELRRRHAAGDPSAGIAYVWRQGRGPWTAEVMQLDLLTPPSAEAVFLVSAAPAGSTDGEEEVDITPFPYGFGVAYADFSLPLPRLARRKRRDSETRRASEVARRLPPKPPARHEAEDERHNTPPPARSQPQPAPAPTQAPQPSQHRRQDPDTDEEDEPDRVDDQPSMKTAARRTVVLDPALWGQIGSADGPSQQDARTLLEREFPIQGANWDRHVQEDVLETLLGQMRLATECPALCWAPAFVDANRRLLKRAFLFKKRAAGVSVEALSAIASAADGADDPNWWVDAERRAAAQLRTKQWSSQPSVPRAPPRGRETKPRDDSRAQPRGRGGSGGGRGRGAPEKSGF
jgi:hypothetical protein